MAIMSVLTDFKSIQTALYSSEINLEALKDLTLHYRVNRVLNPNLPLGKTIFNVMGVECSRKTLQTLAFYSKIKEKPLDIKV